MYAAVQEDPRANLLPVNTVWLQQLPWDWYGTAPGRFHQHPVCGAEQMVHVPTAQSCPLALLTETQPTPPLLTGVMLMHLFNTALTMTGC